MRLGTCLECVESSLGVSGPYQNGIREFTRRRSRLAGRLSGVAEMLIGSRTQLVDLGSGQRKLLIDVLVFGRSKADQQSTLELSTRWDSVGVLKPIIPLYCISLEVDGSDVHHESLRCPVKAEVVFFARKPSRRVSFFPSREVHPHA
ncbi:hypothetical protein B296_00021400 [Ensete ventricosum]|uniref:Uncharacterized protein n=1 Tax=Ensete ventricosum TaxID=4639 RepID=A0A426ZQB9_ENSVE|nr:hypothetical protein B296_00021400 [Ensete ventricosum]